MYLFLILIWIYNEILRQCYEISCVKKNNFIEKKENEPHLLKILNNTESDTENAIYRFMDTENV